MARKSFPKEPCMFCGADQHKGLCKTEDMIALGTELAEAKNAAPEEIDVSVYVDTEDPEVVETVVESTFEVAKELGYEDVVAAFEDAADDADPAMASDAPEEPSAAYRRPTGHAYDKPYPVNLPAAWAAAERIVPNVTVWSNCRNCKASIRHQDMVEVVFWGESSWMCPDCADVFTADDSTGDTVNPCPDCPLRVNHYGPCPQEPADVA